MTTAIREDGKPVTDTYSNIPQVESKIMLHNGKPGLTNLRVTVNGKNFEVAGLKDSEVRTLDVASAMKLGNNNINTLTSLGKPGGSAEILVWDGK